MDGFFMKDPTTGATVANQQSLAASLTSRFTGKGGHPDLNELFLKMGNGANQVLIPAHDAYYHCLQGGPFVPHGRLEGREAFLEANLTNTGTSITVSKATTDWNGVTENIFVPNRPYLLMNRKPEYGEDIYASGTKDGLLLPDAEIVYVDAAYSGGTTVTIARGPLAKARSKGAVIQAIPGLPASFFSQSPAFGVMYEQERPDAVDIGSQQSAVAGEIKAVFKPSAQVATAGGVVTHYAVWILPKSGRYTYQVAGLPECAVPVAVLPIDSASLVGEVLPPDTGETFLTVGGLTQYWDPQTGALGSVSSAGKYWVCVAALNQETFNANTRMSPVSVAEVTVA